jgi:hypothetical protein
MRHSIVALAVLGIVLVSVPGDAQQKEFSFARTRSQGRATAEYRDRELHVVINYDYSQRNHNAAWLLVDMALASASSRRFVLHKKDVRLTTPDGRELSVALQQQVIDDAPAITTLLQNASIFRRQLTSYFNQRGQIEAIRFQTTPPGKGTVSDEATVDNDHVTAGAVLFKHPQGSWQAGTYRFAVDTEVGGAALPIRLE